MKHPNSFYLFLLLLFFTLPSSAQVQQDTIYRFETKDGNEYFGKIISQDNEKILVKTEKLGDITLYKSDIIKMEITNDKKIQKGEYWNENPQAARYFWVPNGYGLRKGEGYYQNVWVFVNQVSYGFTDNISVGVGMVPLFLFAGAPTPVWLTPKVSFPIVKDKINVGAGALIGTVLGEDGFGFGLLYGMSTFGSRDKNFTIGVGWGYADGEMGQRPTINLSGMLRTSRNWYLMTENYYLDFGGGGVGLISFGARRMFKKLGLDFGLFVPFSTDDITAIAFPWLGITLPFGKKTKF
jgi:hypothetical protein